MTLGVECLENRCIPAVFAVTALGDAGAGTLRAAITGSNASGDPTNIINIGVTGTITLESALPTISNNVEISGPGAISLTITRDSKVGNFRIFTIAASTTVQINDVEITGGQVGVRDGYGAGIQNNGTLSLANDNIDNNTTTTDGGAIYSAPSSNLTIAGC